MKVALLGAGAMGSLIGAHFFKGGADVTLVDPFAEHINAISENGLKMAIGPEKSSAVYETVPLKAVLTPEEAGPQDVVVVLVKGLYTKSALEGATALFKDDTVVISFQNGVGNVDIIKEQVPAEKTGYGTLNIGSFLNGPGDIYGNPGNGVHIHFTNNTKKLDGHWQGILDALNAGGLLTKFSDDTDAMIWSKLLINSCVNLPCALARVTMGQLWNHPDGKIIQENIARELVAVAQAQGIDITWESAWNAYVDDTLPGVMDHYPSATQDVMNKRKTEVDFLNGAVVRGGIEKGIPTPYNEVVLRFSHVLQDTYDVQFGTNK
ncbi:MAG: 2-dehydropantoate 2-reductase [Clostridiales Family XIII bacterium]|jgi:2-dehydropantoate 2-reductase|nr:2-dehydropantoate 2-reductase [Clostridiales Family XIII bacterium]